MGRIAEWVRTPTTPRESSLDVTEEAAQIKHNPWDFIAVETLNRPTAECVLQALPHLILVTLLATGFHHINPADCHLFLVIERPQERTEEVDKLCQAYCSTGVTSAYLSVQYSKH